MSSSATSNSKLHPIYTALDHHQYQRAIKLCLQQPADNVFVQALLAHSYAKAEQRPKAVQVLSQILLSSLGTATDEYFCELRLANKYAQTGTATATTAAAEAPAAARSGGKGGKKGKKKPAPKAAAPAPTAPAVAPNDWDWIDALDVAPALPQQWNAIPPGPVPAVLTEPSFLSTLQVTLSFLRLTLTAYQLYAWTATTTATPEHLQETFHLGLAVWMAPQYQHLPVRAQILPHLQGLALQLARLQVGSGATETLWAAQTALWQCRVDKDDDDDDNTKAAATLALLPRLAETWAAKIVRQGPTDLRSRETVEAFLLWLQALEQQGKWQDYLEAVQELCNQTTPIMGLTRAMLLDYKSRALQQLGQTEAARAVVAESLQGENPDQWNMWKRHLDYDTTDSYAATVELAKQLSLEKHDEGAEEQHYPRRGPPLDILEALRLLTEKSDGPKEALLDDLVTQIQGYGDAFASRTACTFSDLTACLNCLCEHGNATKAAVLLPWLAKTQTRPSAQDSSQRRAELRAFIFAHQTTLKLLHRFPELQTDWLPDWKELVHVWKEFVVFEDDFKAAQTEEERKNAQKESRPADEVILLAIQLLLAQNPTQQGLVLAATLLEKAIEQSPYNAYLKLSQIFVCADLNAVSRSWDLFRELFVKHIQHESCAYLILSLLRAGGMYQEVIKVCKEIIRLQITALRDANEYTGTALENGTLSKADEFVCFQRERMNKSLTTLEAKGLIMDCAPLFKHDDRQEDIGSMHGIVGGEDDLERVQQMISEAHNPLGTFSLLRLKGGVQENLPRISENRDLNALAYQVFSFREFPTTDEIVCDCIRRSHHHNLLIRAALCIDATKGPKKGKVVKTTAELEKRCKSLIARVNEAQAFAESELKASAGYRFVILCMTKLCRAIAVVSGGFVSDEPPSQDSVAFREDQMATFLQQAVEQLQSARAELSLSSSTSLTGLALPEIILPTLALLHMCAKVNDVYGWGKKRREIRKCAGCLYDFMLALRGILDDMDKSLEAVQINKADFSLPAQWTEEGVVSGIASDEDVSQTIDVLVASQGETKSRIEKVIQSIRSDLASFDTKE